MSNDEAAITDESFSGVELVLLAGRSAYRDPLLLFIDAYQTNADPLQRAARKGSQKHYLARLDGPRSHHGEAVLAHSRRLAAPLVEHRRATTATQSKSADPEIRL